MPASLHRGQMAYPENAAPLYPVFPPFTRPFSTCSTPSDHQRRQRSSPRATPFIQNQLPRSVLPAQRVIRGQGPSCRANLSAPLFPLQTKIAETGKIPAPAPAGGPGVRSIAGTRKAGQSAIPILRRVHLIQSGSCLPSFLCFAFSREQGRKERDREGEKEKRGQEAGEPLTCVAGS